MLRGGAEGRADALVDPTARSDITGQTALRLASLVCLVSSRCQRRGGVRPLGVVRTPRKKMVCWPLWRSEGPLAVSASDGPCGARWRRVAAPL